jgi:hypothetical protein
VCSPLALSSLSTCWSSSEGGVSADKMERKDINHLSILSKILNMDIGICTRRWSRRRWILVQSLVEKRVAAGPVASVTVRRLVKKWYTQYKLRQSFWNRKLVTVESLVENSCSPSDRANRREFAVFVGKLIATQQEETMVKKVLEKWVPARLTENPVTACLLENLLERWLQFDWQRVCMRVSLERACL